MTTLRPRAPRRGPVRFAAVLVAAAFAGMLGAGACQLNEDGLSAGGGSAGTTTDGAPGGTGGKAGSGGSMGSGGIAGGDGGASATDAGTGGDDTQPDAASDPDAATWTEGGGDDVSAPACGHCQAYGSPRALGMIPSEAHELSGLAVSRLYPGILYGHNDSGDTARVFAFNQDATINTELDLDGATNVDWEDIATGPCPSGSCIYIGDIGDNDVSRTGYAIYRVAEPTTLPGGGDSVDVPWQRFPFVYPDGSHNAESLLVHLQTGRIFVVIKEKNAAAAVYEMPLPLQADQVVTMVRVATSSVPISAGPLTGGAFHPCGDRILIRSKTSIYELTRPAGGDLVAVFTANPVPVPVAVEPQGEAVDYAADGLGYYTGSEIGDATQEPNISFFGCR
ncbi:MAG TPA: hypothetical protein VMU50_13850 [Polyangia bacterium]|nr:hypothetical protein [Polyangia bacterium]